jgi:hypothetical protein
LQGKLRIREYVMKGLVHIVLGRKEWKEEWKFGWSAVRMPGSLDGLAVWVAGGWGSWKFQMQARCT